MLGTTALPTLFAVQADSNAAISVAFRLTWWAGLVCNALRAGSFLVGSNRLNLKLAVIVAIAAVICICACGEGELIPALCIFAICLSTIQSAMPRSFTVGEAVVIAELCAVLFHVTMFSVVLEVPHVRMLTSKLRKIIAIGLFSGVGISTANLSLFRVWPYLNGKKLQELRGTCHCIMTTLMFVLILEWMSYSIGENSLIWVWNYVTEHTATPLKFIVYYLIVLAPALALAPSSHQGSSHQIVVRKYFHLLALVMFIPTILVHIRFMALAFAVALCVFMVAEALRIAEVQMVASFMNPFMARYVDERDSGAAVLTHIYLLLGCALPVFFTYFIQRGVFSANSLLIALSGVTVTGLGDAAASFIGMRFGRHRWPGSKKTFEGSCAMVVAVVALQALCLRIVGFHHLSAASWCRLVLADVLVSLLEACTDQIDNLFLPLYHIALLQMV